MTLSALIIYANVGILVGQFVCRKAVENAEMFGNRLMAIHNFIIYLNICMIRSVYFNISNLIKIK